MSDPHQRAILSARLLDNKSAEGCNTQAIRKARRSASKSRQKDARTRCTRPRNRVNEKILALSVGDEVELNGSSWQAVGGVCAWI
jgi:hypothetical protein